MALSEEEDEEEDHMEATESQPLSGDEKWASRILIYIFKKAYCNCVICMRNLLIYKQYLRYESKNNRKRVDIVEKKQKSQRNIPRKGDVVLRTSES